ncbi:MAG: SAM-dependent methyltransferase [Rhodoferax sp.]
MTQEPDRNPAAPPGKLYLVPAPLDFGCEQDVDLQQTMPLGTLQLAARLHYWVCENAKSTRAYLKRVHEIIPLDSALQALQIWELPRQVHKKGDHNGDFDASHLIGPALAGNDLGLVSEAGMPAVADPGSSVVRAAHEAGITVVPLTGPISLMLALAASGLNGQNFAFVGYLPQDAAQRIERVRELESLALKTGQTQMFIETPYRNAAMLQTLLQTLQHNTRLAVSSGLTLERGICRSDSIRNWRKKTSPLDNSTPAVFALGR